MPLLQEAEGAVNDPIPAPSRTVSAEPVNTMVEPVQHTELAQLANAFRESSPKLGQLADTLAARQKEQGQIEGEQVATELHQKAIESKQSWADLNNSGAITAIENPWTRFYAREAYGRLAAGDYVAWLKAQPDVARVMSSSTDPSAFLKLEASKRQEYQNAHFGNTHGDPLFAGSFDKMTNGYINEENQKYADMVRQRFVGETAENLLNELRSHVGEELDAHTDPAQIVKDLNMMIHGPDGALKGGLAAPIVRNAVAKMIDSIAHERGDASIYQLAKGVKVPGVDAEGHAIIQDLYDSEEMGKLRDGEGNQEGGKAAIDRMERLEGLIRRNNELEAKNKATAGIMSKLIDDQSKDLTKPLDLTPYIQMAKDQGAPDITAKLRSLQHSVLSANLQDNPTEHARLLGAINDNSRVRGASDYITKQTLVGALQSGDISPTDFKDLEAQIDKRDKTARGGRGPHEKDTIVDFYNEGLSLVKVHFPVNDPIMGHMAGADDRFDAATTQYESDWLDFANANPDMDQKQVLAWRSQEMQALELKFPAPVSIRLGAVPQPDLHMKDAASAQTAIAKVQPILERFTAGQPTAADLNQLKKLGLLHRMSKENTLDALNAYIRHLQQQEHSRRLTESTQGSTQ